MKEVYVPDEAAMLQLGASLLTKWKAGDIVFLEGALGAGKTTLVRGLLQSLGVAEVRSPTYNLLQAFETIPPILHADLYRVRSHQGLGIEDYLDTHLCLIEWPDRAEGLIHPEDAWLVHIDFAESGRRVTISPPRS